MGCFIGIIRRFIGVVVIAPICMLLIVFGCILLWLSFIELFFEYILTGDNKYHKHITDLIIFGIPKTIAKIFKVITEKKN